MYEYKDATEVNVGDICLIETGDEIPADGIAFQCYGTRSLSFLSLSLLTYSISITECTQDKKREKSVFSLFNMCEFVCLCVYYTVETLE
jgi:hypothetical protein